MQNEIVSQAFGYAGVMANLCWPLMRRREMLLGGQVLACVLMFFHFALLGAFTGAAIMVVAGLQASLAIPLGNSPHFKAVYLASLLLTPIVCIATWLGAQSVFSSLALVVVCIANFQLNPIHQRSLLIGAIFAWYAHNFVVGSLPGLVSNTLALVVSGQMLIRIRREQIGLRSTKAQA